ncbi:MAG: hypothetical protein EXS09_20240, partial [Gemmataceae bacterium]|nr:hypothetical protein [Gemmataceae bacterium]
MGPRRSAACRRDRRRVEGETWWLWCFNTRDATDYMLDRSRCHPALDKFFVEEFSGVLVSDFWVAYDAVGRLHHKCWPHLLRDLKEVHEGTENGDDWPKPCETTWPPANSVRCP